MLDKFNITTIEGGVEISGRISIADLFEEPAEADDRCEYALDAIRDGIVKNKTSRKKDELPKGARARREYWRKKNYRGGTMPIDPDRKAQAALTEVVNRRIADRITAAISEARPGHSDLYLLPDLTLDEKRSKFGRNRNKGEIKFYFVYVKNDEAKL